MNMTRFYHTLLFFLAPLCVLGADFLVKLVSILQIEIRASVLLLIVLVPYFLFQTGFMYEVTGSQSWSVPLSGYRLEPVFLYRHIGYFYEQDVYGANWMSENVDIAHSRTYADYPSGYVVLSSYGMVPRGNIEVLSNVTVLSENSNVYLSRINVVNGVVAGSDLWNTTSLSHIFGLTNKVYSNGGCEIYKNTP